MKRQSDIEHLSDIHQDPDLTFRPGTFQPMAMPLVRRQFPALFADVLVGVKPFGDKKVDKKNERWKLNPKKQKYIHK